MIYAVQVRSMHTAIHNLLLFKTKGKALKVYNIIKNLEECPDLDDPEFFLYYVDCIEINFRNPPATYKEEKIFYVNDCTGGIDCYNL
jgi:hypothetical protein